MGDGRLFHPDGVREAGDRQWSLAQLGEDQQAARGGTTQVKDGTAGPDQAVWREPGTGYRDDTAIRELLADLVLTCRGKRGRC